METARAVQWFKCAMASLRSTILYYDETVQIRDYLLSHLDEGAQRTIWAYYHDSSRSDLEEYLYSFWARYSTTNEQESYEGRRVPVQVYWRCRNPSAAAAALCRELHQ